MQAPGLSPLEAQSFRNRQALPPRVEKQEIVPDFAPVGVDRRVAVDIFTCLAGASRRAAPACSFTIW